MKRVNDIEGYRVRKHDAMNDSAVRGLHVFRHGRVRRAENPVASAAVARIIGHVAAGG